MGTAKPAQTVPDSHGSAQIEVGMLGLDVGSAPDSGMCWLKSGLDGASMRNWGFWDFLTLHSLVWEIPAVIPAGNLEFGGKMKVEPLLFQRKSIQDKIHLQQCGESYREGRISLLKCQTHPEVLEFGQSQIGSDGSGHPAVLVKNIPDGIPAIPALLDPVTPCCVSF